MTFYYRYWNAFIVAFMNYTIRLHSIKGHVQGYVESS